MNSSDGSLTHDSVYLDARATRQIRGWLLGFPDWKLPLDLVVSLITSGNVLLNLEAFYPDDFEKRTPWRSEFRELRETRKLLFIKPQTRILEIEHAKTRALLHDYPNHTGDFLDDLGSIVRCSLEDIPFLSSTEAAYELAELNAALHSCLPGTESPSAQPHPNVQSIVEFIFSVEIPESLLHRSKSESDCPT